MQRGSQPCVLETTGHAADRKQARQQSIQNNHRKIQGSGRGIRLPA